MEKIKEKGKGKGKKKAEESNGEPAESSKTGGTPMVLFNAMDTVCNAAIIGHCRIDLMNPPAEIEWGVWNDRELKLRQATVLAKELTSMFSPFVASNMLPLVIKAEYVDKSCKAMKWNVEESPMLRLTDEAIKAGIKLQLAGGRHRLRATEIVKEQVKKKINDFKVQIAERKEKLSMEGISAGLKEKLEEKVGALEQALAAEESSEVRFGIWGVMVYDAGMHESET